MGVRNWKGTDPKSSKVKLRPLGIVLKVMKHCTADL